MAFILMNSFLVRLNLFSRGNFNFKRKSLNFMFLLFFFLIFHHFLTVCHLLRMGVSAIFGPQSNTISSHVQSICDTMEIPHLETRWDFRLRRENCLVNLYPHPSILSRVRERYKTHSGRVTMRFYRCHGN